MYKEFKENLKQKLVENGAALVGFCELPKEEKTGEFTHAVSIAYKLSDTVLKTIDKKPIYDVEATIYCLRNSHKGIIIGKGGNMLKKIGTYARQDLEKMLDTKINLKLWVKVKEDWLNNDKIVKKFKPE